MRAPISLSEVIRSPAFFDIASVRETLLPQEILEEWIASSGNSEDAERLLAPYIVYGTVLISDAGGLSKLSSEYDLIDLLSIIHAPKKTIHALGSAIGGVSVGRWVADNTTMFFPEDTSKDALRNLLQSLQCHLSSHKVRTGVGMHTDYFYKIGDTLFGPALERFDEIAENEVNAGEVWVSQEASTHLELEKHFGLTPSTSPEFHVLPSFEAPAMDVLENQTSYPHAFSEDFYSMLDIYTATGDSSVKIVMTQLCSVTKSVVFLKYHAQPGTTLSSFMDRVLISLLWKKKVAEVAEICTMQCIKADGSIAILLADDGGHVKNQASTLIDFLKTNGFEVSMGVDTGEIFLFNLGGGMDVAGEAVNVASKLSEDLGEKGTGYMVVRDGSTPSTVLSCSGIEIPVISLL